MLDKLNRAKERYTISKHLDFLKNRLGFLNHLSWSGIKTRFIISTGRTGTKFLAYLFNQLSPIIDARHEPGPNFRELGIKYATRKVSFEKARKIIDNDRRVICDELLQSDKHIYIEANCNLFSLIPIIRDIFPDYRIVHIVRDGRYYVRSAMSRPLFRNDDRLKRLSAAYFPDDPYHEHWSNMSRFEKICWHWVKMDRIIYESIQNDNNCLTLQFENIFDASNLYPGIKKMIDFFDMDIDVDFENIFSLMSKKINLTEQYQIPDWMNWDSKRKKQFLKIASKHMDMYGYDVSSMIDR